jgi:putative transposase
MNANVLSYHGYRFPPDIIGHAVRLYYRFSPSFRDVEDLLAQRGTILGYETIRQWCRKFGAVYARRLRRRQGRLGDTGHLDELFVTIQDQRQYLWRAVHQDGDTIDILVQSRRDQRAAERLFRKLPRGQQSEPRRRITDKLRTYRAAHRAIMPYAIHDAGRHANNCAEVSHQPTRHRESQMRGFKSASQAQRFLSVRGIIQDLCHVGRQSLPAANHRILRSRSFLVRDEPRCAK